MPVYTEKRVLPYAQEQLFSLVAEVEKYPEFLPWCLGARVRKRSLDLVEADLIIGFKMVREALYLAGEALPSRSHRRRVC